MSLRKYLVEYLKQNQGQKFAAQEIALWVWNTYPDYCRKKMDNSTVINNEIGLIKQLIAEIGSMYGRIKESNNIKRVKENNKMRYYYVSDKDNETNKQENEYVKYLKIDFNRVGEVDTLLRPCLENKVYKEEDLYPILGEFISHEFTVYGKRIDEKRSRHKGKKGNLWLHPDIVGIQDLGKNWLDPIVHCDKYTNSRLKLWSFEVKLSIDNSTVREAFFQAVSNSVWANFGYLAIGKIKNDKVMEELQTLSRLYGVGVIELNASNPNPNIA